MKMLLLSLMLVCVVACKKSMYTESQVRKDIESASVKSIRYLALGDSYTKGESVAANQSFPSVLSDSLTAEPFIEVRETRSIAQTGWTTANLLAAIKAQHIPDTFDLVTLLIGVNNQYQGLSVETYRTEFTLCLQQAIALAGGRMSRVVVMSIPDYGYTPFGEGNQEQISREIDTFNAINKAIADSLNISYINITPISRSGKEGLVASDGLHPSGKQYKLWVEALYPVVKQKVLQP